MSTLAGFDVVAELSNAAVLRALQNTAINGLSMNCPSEITLPINNTGITGQLHMILKNVQLDFNGDDTITTTLIFSKTSILINSPVSTAMTSLAGTITVQAPIELITP